MGRLYVCFCSAGCAVTLEGSKFYEDCSCWCHPRCKACGRGLAVDTLDLCPPCAGARS